MNKEELIKKLGKQIALLELKFQAGSLDEMSYIEELTTIMSDIPYTDGDELVSFLADLDIYTAKLLDGVEKQLKEES